MCGGGDLTATSAATLPNSANAALTRNPVPRALANADRSAAVSDTHLVVSHGPSSNMGRMPTGERSKSASDCCRASNAITNKARAMTTSRRRLGVHETLTLIQRPQMMPTSPRATPAITSITATIPSGLYVHARTH